MTSSAGTREISLSELEDRVRALNRRLAPWLWTFFAGGAGIFVTMVGGLVGLWSDGVTFRALGVAFVVTAVGITMLERRHNPVAQELGLFCPACERVFVEHAASKLRAGRCRCGHRIVTRSDRLTRAAPDAKAAGLPTLERLQWRARGYRFTEIVVGVVGAAAFLIAVGAPFKLQLGIGRGLLYFALPLAAGLFAWWWLADKLPHWFGVTCPACDTLLIGERDEAILGAASETKECPECGAAVAR